MEMDWQWPLMILAALCIGFSKAGFSGVSLISVFLFVDMYGAKTSLGVMLPLLIVADLMLYPAFRKYGSWSQVWPLFLPTGLGMVLAVWILVEVSDVLMRQLIGVVILIMVLLQFARARWKAEVEGMAQSPVFAYFCAGSGGVATVLANAAGPITQLFLLSRKMEKMELIGVGARLFLVVNLVKLPLNAKLNLMSAETLKTGLILVPFVAIGVFFGRSLLQKVPQLLFEWMVVCFALFAGIRLLFF